MAIRSCTMSWVWSALFLFMVALAVLNHMLGYPLKKTATTTTKAVECHLRDTWIYDECLPVLWRVYRQKWDYEVNYTGRFFLERLGDNVSIFNIVWWIKRRMEYKPWGGATLSPTWEYNGTRFYVPQAWPSDTIANGGGVSGAVFWVATAAYVYFADRLGIEKIYAADVDGLHLVGILKLRNGSWAVYDPTPPPIMLPGWEREYWIVRTGDLRTLLRRYVVWFHAMDLEAPNRTWTNYIFRVTKLGIFEIWAPWMNGTILTAELHHVLK